MADVNLSPKPYVTVIIPVYNQWDKLWLCLQALEQQTYPQEQIKILVIDNNPTDVARTLPDSKLNITLLQQPKPGSYAARNLGITNAQGDVLAFTDSDCIPHPNWILEGITTMVNFQVPRVGGRVEVIFNSSTPKIVELYDSLFSFPQEQLVSQGTAVTANVFIKKHLFSQVGLFDETLLSGGDSQWGRRAQNLGYPIVYAPEAMIQHPARSTLKELLIKTRRISAGVLWNPPSFWFLRGFHPPVDQILQICEQQTFGVTEKLGLLVLAYLVKLTKTWHRTLLVLGVQKPRRA